MEKSLIKSIKEKFKDKSNDELLEIYSKNDTIRYSREAIEASRLLLEERQQLIPEKKIVDEKIFHIIPRITLTDNRNDYSLILTSHRFIFGKIFSLRRTVLIILAFGLILSLISNIVIGHGLHVYLIPLFMGILGYIIYLIGESYQKSNIYDGKTPNEIIDMNNQNFSYNLEDINSIVIKNRIIKLKIKIDNLIEIKKIASSTNNIKTIKDKLNAIIPSLQVKDAKVKF